MWVLKRYVGMATSVLTSSHVQQADATVIIAHSMQARRHVALDKVKRQCTLIACKASSRQMQQSPLCTALTLICAWALERQRASVICTCKASSMQEQHSTLCGALKLVTREPWKDTEALYSACAVSLALIACKERAAGRCNSHHCAKPSMAGTWASKR